MADVTCRDYLFEYYHDGAWWTFTVPCGGPEDALIRQRQIRQSAKVLGEVGGAVPERLGAIARAWCWLRNLPKAWSPYA